METYKRQRRMVTQTAEGEMPLWVKCQKHNPSFSALQPHRVAPPCLLLSFLNHMPCTDISVKNVIFIKLWKLAPEHTLFIFCPSIYTQLSMFLDFYLFFFFGECIKTQKTEFHLLQNYSHPLLWHSKLWSGASCLLEFSLRCGENLI